MTKRPNKLPEAVGLIHQVLYCNGAVSLEWMCKATGLPEDVVNRGIGWLACEGRLSVEKRSAGRDVRLRKATASIAGILRSSGPMSVARVRRATGLQPDVVNQGLGWLAREGRLTIAAFGVMRRAPIGEVAAVIWRNLHRRGPTPKKEFCSAMGLQENLADQGIGWLLREGRLVLEDRRKRRVLPFQRMSEFGWQVARSNWPVMKRHVGRILRLSSYPARQASEKAVPNGMLFLSRDEMGRQVRIEEAAGLLCSVLCCLGECASVEDLLDATDLLPDVVNQGIGWLAREGKASIGANGKGRDCLRLTTHPAG